MAARVSLRPRPAQSLRPRRLPSARAPQSVSATARSQPCAAIGAASSAASPPPRQERPYGPRDRTGTRRVLVLRWVLHARARVWSAGLAWSDRTRISGDAAGRQSPAIRRGRGLPRAAVVAAEYEYKATLLRPARAARARQRP